MANTLKKKTPPPPDPEKLAPEKEVEVTVTEVVKDERTTKIAGAISLLVAAFLFVSFTSYLFNWKTDQDKIFQFTDIFKSGVRVGNLMGVLGAYFAHLFIYKGFGIASFLFCTFFFALGVNLLFGKKVFSLIRNLKYVIVGLLVLSVAASFASAGSTFSWGGGVGELMTSFLLQWIGSAGTGALLGLAVLSYIIWRFNPTFKLPQFKPRVKQENFSSAKQPEHVKEEEKMFVDEEEPMETEPAYIRSTYNDLYADDDSLTHNNKLKNDSKGVVVILPKQEEKEHIAFDLTEKEFEPESVKPSSR